jgi:beta-glucanase (GH16 family)
LDESLWSLNWSDEFNDTSLDTTKWGYIVGGGGYGNNEQQNYTSRTNNIRLENGKLVIQAIPETYENESYTSAQITTQGKADWTYGKYEFRAKLPEGQGLWPAIWTLPTDISVYGGAWPICGEMDIMEYIVEPRI